MTSERDQRKEIDLPAGRIRYREAGTGKPIVFVHGYLVDGRLWDGVVDRLSDRYRCLAPDWPIGAQQIAMKPDADLSPPGVAATIASFLEALDLEDVTIVGNDSGGAMSQVLVTRHPERIGRLVLTNCDTYENFPPGIFKAMPPLAKLPGGMTLLSLPFRSGAIARAAFKPFTRKPIPAQLIASWMNPGMNDRGCPPRPQEGDRGDEQAPHAGGGTSSCAARSCRSCSPGRPGTSSSRSPAPNGSPPRPATRASSRSRTPSTFVPLDQPQLLSEEIGKFVAGT